jgi:hypothetical protein
LNKAGILYSGYKTRIAIDKDGLAEAMHTTPANEHDSCSFEKVMDKVNK